MSDLERAVAQLVDRRVAELLDGRQVDDGVLLVSTPEAGRRLGVSRDTVVTLCETGELNYVEGLGRGRLVTTESLSRYVERKAVDHRRRRQVPS